jgi:DNA anti-recombination protein RmuC
MLKARITAGIVLTLGVSLSVQAANIYKYKDDQGNVILGSRVPAEYVKNGYQVLNERGRVIQEVARVLTPEELAALSDEQEQQRLAEEATRKQEEDDRLLLRLYRSPEEVIRRRDTTIGELDAQIEALSALHNDAQERVDRLQETADSNVAAGREVPATIASQLEDSSEELARLNRQLVRIQNERAETLSTAQKNIDRLKELLNLE